ncbi:hypothetical protein PENSPDRAFT_194947 [Peniophora sp. CONT]|nr:hypothetical protein PENSPDRAFT_194947 [Peniophora sp. CONT]
MDTSLTPLFPLVPATAGMDSVNYLEPRVLAVYICDCEASIHVTHSFTCQLLAGNNAGTCVQQIVRCKTGLHDPQLKELHVPIAGRQQPCDA